MTGEPPRRSVRSLVTDRTVVTVGKIVFGVAVVIFGVLYVAQRWGQVRPALAAAHPQWLVLAGVFAALGLGWAMMGTRFALEVTSGRRLPVPAAARLFFVSQLGKYIPGSIWPIVAVTAMAGRFRIRSTESASAGLLSMFLSIVTGGCLGLVTLLAGGTAHGGRLWWLALLLPVAVLIANPAVVFAVLNAVLRVVRRPTLSGPPNRGVYGAALGVTAVSWVFLGLQCWALCVALGAGAAGSLLGAAGGFALAYTAGTLFVPAPAGAGVREAVLGFALAGTVTGSGTFTSGSVVAVVLLSRVLLALLDFAMAGLAVALHAWSDSSVRAEGAPHRPPDGLTSPSRSD